MILNKYINSKLYAYMSRIILAYRIILGYKFLSPGKRRAFMTGLTGSAGNAIVLKDAALVTTDSSSTRNTNNKQYFQ